MASLSIVEKTIGNVDAELCVISAMLYEPKVIDAFADTLRPDHFVDLFLGHVYSLIVREHSLGRAATPITIRPFLEGEPAFEELGGARWLFNLAHGVSVIAARGAAAQIIEFAQRRKLMEGLKETLLMGDDYEQPVEALIAAADNALAEARDESGADEYSASACLNLVIEGFEHPVSGVLCDIIPPIDRLLGPMRPKHLVIGAGRPGMGKTATAVSYALGAAERGHGVLFISLEMGADELAERMAADLCLEHRVPYAAIRDRTLNADQKREVCRAHARLENMPLQIVDRAGMTIAQLRTRVRRWARRFEARGHRLELVIVDYLQLMRADRKMDRYEAVTEISRSLKEIAKDHGLAVFALAQLSREVEKRADKRPILSDLRDSGQIEQDADAVLFFLRQEYYLRLEGEPRDDEAREKWQRRLDLCTGRIEFICAKRRNGASGSETGQFLYHYQAVRG